MVRSFTNASGHIFAWQVIRLEACNSCISAAAMGSSHPGGLLALPAGEGQRLGHRAQI